MERGRGDYINPIILLSPGQGGGRTPLKINCDNATIIFQNTSYISLVLNIHYKTMLLSYRYHDI